MTTFNSYLSQARTQTSLALDASWGQGRTTFGGMSAALLIESIEQLRDEDQCLRSVNVHFCAPLSTNETIDCSTQLLRAGKSTAHYQALAQQQGQIGTLLTACYGRARSSAVMVPSLAIELGQPGKGQMMPFIKGITPDFTQHLEFCYVEGGLPFSKSTHNHLRGWMRFRQSDNDQSLMKYAHLLALIDAWPPVLLQKLSHPAPCASVTWNVELVTPLSELEQPLMDTDWLWYEADIRQAQDGYGHTEARVYSNNGTLLALSRQLVAVYDQR